MSVLGYSRALIKERMGDFPRAGLAIESPAMSNESYEREDEETLGPQETVIINARLY